MYILFSLLVVFPKLDFFVDCDVVKNLLRTRINRIIRIIFCLIYQFTVKDYVMLKNIYSGKKSKNFWNHNLRQQSINSKLYSFYSVKNSQRFLQIITLKLSNGF